MWPRGMRAGALGVAVLLALGLLARTAQAEDRAVVQLTDDNFDHVVHDFELVMVNFYADWCRFCQQLEPAYEQAARLLGDSLNARLARLDCEDPRSQRKKLENSITKYPTIKIFRHGRALSAEYRGQRSATAIERFVREMMADPIITASSPADVKGQLEKHRRAVVGHFASNEHPAMALFSELGRQMRDNCHFIAFVGSPEAGPAGAKLTFKTLADEHAYEGDVTDRTAVSNWMVEECTPLVREITFENGEELTEEGLPFIILFYDPADMHPVQQFSRYVRAHLERYRGFVNFITADGNKFNHPLQHLGKTKKDLPVLAADTFRHMFLFKNFKRIHREGVLQKFIDDVLSGKLHQELHNPQMAKAPEHDPYGSEYDEYMDEPEPIRARKETIKEKLEDAANLKRESEEAANLVKKAETASKAMAEKMQASTGQPTEAIENEDDEHHLPVPVKSVLNRLRPSDNRYTLLRNRDEL